NQVERPGPEPVLGAGERARRADLDGVDVEVGLERLLRADPDLLERAPLQQIYERITSDLLGEAAAPLAEHAPLPVQQDLAGDRDRFGEGALGLVEPGVRATVLERLVLHRALPALVADWAVQRVVDQQQFHDALMRLVR